MNSSLKAWTRALELTAPIERGRAPILPCVIDSLADRFDSAPALIDREDTLSYQDLAAASQRIARWGMARGLAPGDVVGLLMENSAHYLPIWLGLTRIGATVALLNTHLKGELLAHSINLVRPRHLIVGTSLVGVLEDVRRLLAPGLPCWGYGRGEHPLPRLELEIAAQPAGALSEGERAAPALEDRALYIYTSGTTGLPKAAVVSHYRLMQWSHWFAGLMETRPNDRMYDCLPMYHSIGGVVATGATLVGGGSVVVRERFSASEFWRDIHTERCTLFQYIGELCRYLLASPPDPLEREHELRLCCGNGLRGDVWEAFQERFGVPKILEYYAATEGTFSLYNCEGKTGAIGRIPPFLSHRMPVALVRFDEDTGAPWRDEAGRCARCVPDEVGEAIGQVADAAGSARGRFEGYTDAEASRQKLLRNVFAEGDAWYRTGDLMRTDGQGFYYFVDRVGDTFRWKGENVSTGEVAGILLQDPQVREAVVFGVSVPGADGKVGMAALVVTPEFALERLRVHLRQRLPDYARPVFVRLVQTVELTGTFKLRKTDLARQGFDPVAVSDPVFIDDPRQGMYVPLGPAIHAQLLSGKLRL